MKITTEFLKERNACEEGLVWFEEHPALEGAGWREVSDALIADDEPEWAVWLRKAVARNPNASIDMLVMLAKAIQLFHMTHRIVSVPVEADDHFTDEEGVYKYMRERVGEAHALCKSNVRALLAKGECAIVANTSTRRWEYQPYLGMAEELKILVQVIDLYGDFGNVHGVPEEKVKEKSDG